MRLIQHLNTVPEQHWGEHAFLCVSFIHLPWLVSILQNQLKIKVSRHYLFLHLFLHAGIKGSVLLSLLLWCYEKCINECQNIFWPSFFAPVSLIIFLYHFPRTQTVTALLRICRRFDKFQNEGVTHLHCGLYLIEMSNCIMINGSLHSSDSRGRWKFGRV